MAEVKYYIDYQDFLEHNLLDKNIDINSEELKIVKKYKDGTFTITPILYFKEYQENFLEYAKMFKNNKKGISLMVELTEEESKICNPIYLKKYITYDKKHFELLPKTIKLINYEAYRNMPIKELNSGNVHKLVAVLPNNNNYYEINQNDLIVENKAIFEIREELNQKRVGCDLYFLTDDKDIINKYSDEITELEEVKDGIYKMTSKKVIVIDSIPQTIVNDMIYDTFKCLYTLCNKSVTVNITENENNNYEIDTNKSRNYSKKGYMYIGSDFYSMLYNASILPILKYINIYELVSDKEFKKINLEEYLKEKNILKYIKKPSKN